MLAPGWGLACSTETPEFPGARLQARVESHLEQQRAALKTTLVHYGLVFPVEQADLIAYLRPIRFHGRGLDVALGTEFELEPHGGGILQLLFDYWRPEGRSPGMQDRFRFAPNGESLALGEIYRAQRSQVFLPVPGERAESLGGRLPDAPQLPRMRMPLRLPDGRHRFIEVDAYKLLGLLVALEPEPARTWVNNVGQQLSVELLLQHARRHYLGTGDSPGEPADHSNLHLVELLLAYHRRHEPSESDAIKQRFLAVEMERGQFDAEDEAVLLGHYVESLGQLAADPNLRWTDDEKRRVRTWLRQLEKERFPDLAVLEVNGLAHLLRGLRLIEAHPEALE